MTNDGGDAGRVRYREFEELPVWRAAAALAVEVFDLTAAGLLKGHAGLRDQLERAVNSVSNNIAEGYERGTHEELLTFLYYARGSAGEVRSMLRVIDRGAEWAEWRAETTRLITLASNVANQLGAWLRSLQNSASRGPRYENDQTRKGRESARRAEAFMGELRRLVAEKSPHVPLPPERPSGG